MLLVTLIRNLVVGIALALLAQVACAQQAEFSFELGKVPAEVAVPSAAVPSAAVPRAAVPRAADSRAADSNLVSPKPAATNQLQFAQLPEFTAPREGAAELIGLAKGQAVSAFDAGTASRTNRKPSRSPGVVQTTARAPEQPIATHINRPTRVIEARATPQLAIRGRSPTPTLVTIEPWPVQQIAGQQTAVQQATVQANQFPTNTDQADKSSWTANPFAKSDAVPQGVASASAIQVQTGVDFFAPHSASTIDRQAIASTSSSLVQTSAAAFTELVVEPVNAPERIRLALTPPKAIGVKTTAPTTNSGSTATIDPKGLRRALAGSASAGSATAEPTTVKPKTPAAEPAKPAAKKTTKAAAKKAAKKDGSDLPNILQGNKNFKLAAQPEQGAHFRDDTPLTDARAHQIETLEHDFSPGPSYEGSSYFSQEQQNVYAGKKLYANQRPLVELGRPWYQLGQLSEGYTWFGKHNPITPQFLIYGDFRTAIASNNVGGDGTTRTASELNLDFDLKLTGTERFHMFMSPLDNGVQNTGYNFDEEEFEDQLDANIDFGYFEGDLGAMVGGFTGETLPFDLPFAVGVMPLLIQNGVWFDDAFLGVAATLPARNSARFNISNMDITFFAGYDKISSDAFPGDDSAARMYGVASFIEALNGYIEIDYAFLDDRSFDNRSYHNFAFAYSRRYGRLVSNSTRIIVNAGQSSDVVENTADGVLLLSENSLITGSPSSLVPYFNCFAGFDRPQSAARAVQAGGVLRNTGILFETDGMTGFPTLDPTANDTYGAALGINLIADDFSQQLMVEVAALGVMGEDNARNAPGEQIGVGFRYQLPLTNSKILRMDGMYGFLNNADDISGIRMELRQKW